MSITEMIRIALGTIFLFAGIGVFIIEIIGIFKMKYVLNRLHAAAMGDTLGLILSIVGLCFFSGISFTTAKFILVVVLFWVASPVASHMTALLESYTNDRLKKHLYYEGDLETLEKRLEKEEKNDSL